MMKGKVSQIQFYTCILIFILSFAGTVPITGQEAGTIVSPAKGDTVKNGELFVVFDINPSIQFKPGDVNLFIDKLKFTPMVKLKKNRLTALILKPMKAGDHEIEIKVIDDNKDIHKQRWQYVVAKPHEKASGIPDTEPEKDDKVVVTGSLTADARIVDLSGEGAGLRQEPPETYNLRYQGGVRFKKLFFPVKIAYTNHESRLLPPRNRFMAGIETEKAGLYAGDVNPGYDRLLLNSFRVRGGEGYIKLRNVRLGIIHGEITRSREGEHLYWDMSQGFQPVNMQPLDSSYVQQGVYSRNLSAFNLRVEPANSGNKLRFTLLRSSDNTGSISYGGPAAQNVAASVNGLFVGRENRYKIDVTVAVSAKTADIRKGAVSKEEFDSTFHKELRINPLSLGNFFIVNSTTVPLTTKNANFLGFDARSRFNILKQTITIDISRLGSSFESFGNPYLQNDRFNVSFRDRVGFLKKRINLSVYYRYNEDNLSKTRALKNITHMGGTDIAFIISPKVPQIIAGYRIYNRQGKSVSEDVQVQDIRVSNISAGLNYNVITGNFQHRINISINRNIRENFMQGHSGNTNNTVNFTLVEEFPCRISLSAHYNQLLLANDTLTLAEYRTLGFRLGYLTKNKKLRVGVNGMEINSGDGSLYPGSVRYTGSAEVQYFLWENTSLKLQAGNSNYSEPDNDMRSYNENWALVSLKHSFNKR